MLLSNITKTKRLQNAIESEIKEKPNKLNESIAEEEKQLFKKGDADGTIKKGSSSDEIANNGLLLKNDDRGRINEEQVKRKIQEFTTSDLLYDMFCIKPRGEKELQSSRALKIKLLNKQFKDIKMHTETAELYESLSELKKKIQLIESNFESMKKLVNIDAPMVSPSKSSGKSQFRNGKII